MSNHTLPELIEFLRGKSVYIQTHNMPDPDAIASAVGMHMLLKHFNIDSTMCYHGAIDRLNTKKMTELLDINIVSQQSLQGIMTESDPIICVDSQKGGSNILDLIGDEVACVDHHPEIVGADYFYKDVTICGSCATIVTRYFKELNIDMDERTATALLYGLKMDTSGFSRGVVDEDIEAFAYLYKRCNHVILGQLEKNQMVFQDLDAYGAAISNIKIYDKIGIANIPFSCPDALIAIASDFILSLDEVDVAIVYAQRKDGYKFSIRSEVDDVDSGKLVAKALEGIGSGGGHAFMAGGFLPAANIPALGTKPDEFIASHFIEVLHQTRK